MFFCYTKDTFIFPAYAVGITLATEGLYTYDVHIPFLFLAAFFGGFYFA